MHGGSNLSGQSPGATTSSDKKAQAGVGVGADDRPDLTIPSALSSSARRDSFSSPPSEPKSRKKKSKLPTSESVQRDDRPDLSHMHLLSLPFPLVLPPPSPPCYVWHGAIATSAYQRNPQAGRQSPPDGPAVQRGPRCSSSSEPAPSAASLPSSIPPLPSLPPGKPRPPPCTSHGNMGAKPPRDTAPLPISVPVPPSPDRAPSSTMNPSNL